MNDKVKSLFFSQYYELYCAKLPNDNFLYCITPTFLYKDVPYAHLLLRDISQLTDEEGLNIDIIWGYGKTANCDHGKKLGEWIVNNSRSLYPDISFRVYQYLLRIGILLPFTYLNDQNQPITLTPTEIIALGGAKLQSNEQ